MTDLIQASLPHFQRLISKFKPGTSTAMKSAVVALYTADPTGKLRFSKLIGLLQIDIDRALKTKVLRIYDLDTLTLGFECELFYGFQNNYRPVNETLYMFDYARGSIAFQFRNRQEAEIMAMKIKSQCPSLEEFEALKKSNLEAQRKREEESSFFGKIKNFFGGSEEKEEVHASEVLNWQKNTSITLNLEDGTFNTDNIPPEWQEMFDQLQLKKEDLKDKEIMGIVFEETIIMQAKKQAEKEGNKDMQLKIKEAQREQENDSKQYEQDMRRATQLNLPLPPPPPLTPLLAPPDARKSHISNRGNLMGEILQGDFKLKHVEVNQKKEQQTVSMDISNMEKDERKDLGQIIAAKIRRRGAAFRVEREDDD